MFPSSRSVEHLERIVDNLGKNTLGVMDPASGEEFVRYIERYDAHIKQMKDLTMDDIEPIEQDDEACMRMDSMQQSMLEQDQDVEIGSEMTPGTDVNMNINNNVNSQGTTANNNGSEPIYCRGYRSIPRCPDDMNLTHELLNKLVILRLNGGLGTSMGCKGPKSAIEVRNSLSFLDMAVRQVEFLNTKHGVDVPLVLMNSFNTDEETKRVLSKYAQRHVSILTFRQSCFPKIDKTTMEPLPKTKFARETQKMWYPPGHGDIYASLARCGLLQQLISKGKEYMFISNIDNLGATVDLNILYHIMENDKKFCMEVTKRERQDVSGGTLVTHKGRPLLLENAALPKTLGDTLRRDKRFDKFNTNNLWVNLRELQRLVATRKSLALQVILKEKTTIDSRGEEIPTMMFSTAAGAAINLFEDVSIVVVSRKRFLPVKTTDDLFAVQSDLFTVKHGALRLNEKRTISPPVPTVKLGPYFRTVEEYLKRLPFGVPDIIDLEHLTVSGDVHFRNHVTLTGTVIIVAEEGSHIDICSGSVIRDKVVTGNLRILDH